MAKILCVLYGDPITGYPNSCVRNDTPKTDRHPGGQTAPTPKAIDFTPDELLGSAFGELPAHATAARTTEQQTNIDI